MAKRSDITIEKILTDYQNALVMAQADGKTGDMIAAATAQAKLVGLLIERKEVGAAGDFSNMESISEVLQAVADQAGPEAALALSKVFNLVGSQQVVVGIQQLAPADEEAAETLYRSKSGSDQVN